MPWQTETRSSPSTSRRPVLDEEAAWAHRAAERFEHARAEELLACALGRRGGGDRLSGPYTRTAMSSPSRTKWLVIAGVAFTFSALALSAWSISLAGEHERAHYGSQGHTSGGLAPQARTSPDPDGWWGNPLPEPLAKADFRLTDQHGRSFSFLEDTEGATTLLFFGFTHCLDVCPGTMAMIAAAERQLPGSVAEDLEVVFVTTDPARDTPARLEEWIGLFDPGFTALTGSPDALAEAQTHYDVPPAEREQLGDGVYAMRHLDQVLAFGPDGVARYAYAPGTPPEGLAADLERLANVS